MDLFIDLEGFDVTVTRITNNRYDFRVFHKDTQKSEVVVISESIGRLEVLSEDNTIKLEIEEGNGNSKRLIEFDFEYGDILNVDRYEYHGREFIENIFSKDFSNENGKTITYQIRGFYNESGKTEVLDEVTIDVIGIDEVIDHVVKRERKFNGYNGVVEAVIIDTEGLDEEEIDELESNFDIE